MAVASFNFRDVFREPALLIDSLETGLILLVAFGISMSGDQQNYIVAAVVGLAGLAKAVTTHPWPVTAFTDAARALLVLVAAFGWWDWATPNHIAVAVTFLGTLVTVIARAQISPNTSPQPEPVEVQ